MPKVSEEHLEAKRETILHAAVACFVRDGFHKTTMSDIAEMAGVSDGLAYRYFSGKDEIIQEAVRLASGSQVADFESLDEDDVEAMIELLYWSSFKRFELPDRATTVGLRMRSWSEALEDEEVRRPVVARWERYAPVTERLWRRAQEEGLIPTDLDPTAISRVMLAIHDGLDLQWALDRGLDVEDCREVFMALIRGWLSVGRGESSEAE